MKLAIWGNTQKPEFWDLFPNLISWLDKRNHQIYISSHLHKRLKDNNSFKYSVIKNQNDFKTVDWDFSEDDLNRTREKIARVGGYIDSEEKWVKKPSTLCNWCDYKSICQPDSWI